MRKQSPSSERSKVRIFFVDADLAPGDMEELTHALTSAIRPTHVLTRVGQTQRLAPARADAGGDGAHDAEPALEEADLTVEPEREAPTPKGPARARSYRKPQPVDLDMNAGGKAFEEFAKEKAPTSHRGKYLVAAAWLHDYAKVETITADHVFTCYKAAGWTFDVSDPTVTFRQLKMEGLGGLKRGNFSINHLGLAEVQKMPKS